MQTNASEFASIKSANTIMRYGPGQKYPPAWKFLYSGIPIVILATFDNWAKIRDCEGSEGWIHISSISNTNFIIIISDKVTMYDDHNRSKKLAILKKGVIAKVVKGDNNINGMIKIECRNFIGWVRKTKTWGR